MKEPRSPGHRYATLYDTGKKCLIIMDCLYADLIGYVQIASDSDRLQSSPDTIVRLYTCVFSMIDFAHRFSEIIDAMPLLPKGRPEVRKLTNAFSGLDACRNYAQHIRNHLSQKEPIDFPILGSVSWIQKNRNYVLLPTQLTEGFGTPGIPFDSKLEKYLCKLQFTIGPHRIALDTIYEEAKTFWSWLETISNITPAEVKQYIWGSPNILFSELTTEP